MSNVMGFLVQTNGEKMKVYISKKTMRLNSKRIVNGIAAVLFLLLLSALTSVSAYEEGDTFRDCATCPEMVVLPAGKFTMGSPEGERGRDDDEGPQHQVTIPKLILSQIVDIFLCPLCDRFFIIYRTHIT